MADRPINRTVLCQNRAAEGLTREIFLYDGVFLRERLKMRECFLQGFFCAANAIALRGSEAECFAAMGLYRARKRHTGKKRVQIFARFPLEILRNGNGKLLGEAADSGLIVEKR